MNGKVPRADAAQRRGDRAVYAQRRVSRVANRGAFYNQYVVQNEASATNPETGAPWGPAEFPATIDRARLRVGQPMDDARVAVLVAFLRTLTDQRYEQLLDSGN